MLINVRYGVFETNSSSVHSLSLPLKRLVIDSAETRKRYGDGRPLTVSFGEYSWGPDWLCSMTSKLSYIVTSMQYYVDGMANDELSEPAKLALLYQSKYYKWLKEVILDYTSWTDLILSTATGEWADPLGYIDHQSIDTLEDLFHADEKEFKQYVVEILFDDRVEIHIDNDN